MRPTVTLGAGALDLATMAYCLAGPVSVELAADGLERVRRARQTVVAIIDAGEPVYGVNTGFGKLASVRIGPDDLGTLQVNIVRSHAAGVGPPLPAGVVRLAMVLKLASLMRGASGVRVELVKTLAAMLDADIVPVIPAKGSVGASGDLAPLAHMALVAIGEGEAFVAGQRLAGAAALAIAGLKPVTLAAKEGLALLNGTQVSTALAVAGLVQAKGLRDAALVAGAMATDAIMGSDAPFDARLHELRPHPGQIAVAASLRRLMRASEIRAAHATCERVQDPYSFRCQPQVMGAVCDLIDQAEAMLLREADAVSDNPIVLADQGEVISGGNFHGEPVAFAADMLAIAMAETAALSERRIAALIDPTISHLPAFLTPDPGLNSGYMLAQVTAAALASELKHQAHPASIDSLPTSANQEDHVSMATHASRRLTAMADNLTDIIAIELLAAAEGIDLRAPLKTSPLLRRVHAAIRAHVPPRIADRDFSADIAAVSRLVRSGDIAAMCQEAL